MLGLPLAELLESDVKKSQRSAVHCSAQCCKECDSLASDLEEVHAPVGFAAELGLADTCPLPVRPAAARPPTVPFRLGICHFVGHGHLGLRNDECANTREREPFPPTPSAF